MAFPYTFANLSGTVPASYLDANFAVCVQTTDVGTAAAANVGTSGATVPLLNGVNTWSGGQTFGSITASSVTSAGSIGLAGAGELTWTARVRIFCSAIGAIEMYNAALTAGAYLTVGVIKTIVTTVGGLPSAATVGRSARAYVTDANAPTFAAVVAGGGAVEVPVYSDGTNWRVG